MQSSNFIKLSRHKNTLKLLKVSIHLLSVFLIISDLCRHLTVILGVALL